MFEHGIKTSGGKPYSKDKVKYILKNPFYYGHFVYAGEIYEGKHTPIISKKLFNKVQSVIKHDKRFNRAASLLRCSYGMMITAENKTKRQKNGNTHHYVYYRCSRKNKSVKCVEPAVRSELLDQQLSDLLAGFALSEEYADKMHRWATADEIAGKAQVDSKIDDMRSELAHLSDKLQRLLDGFLDGILEREVYTQKKAEIMSQKKTIEEQISDLTLGTLEWVEPLNNWLERAVSICKIAYSTDQKAKKSLLLEIFGLNLKLKNKNVVAFSDPKSHSPQENILVWLRQMHEKIAQMGDNSAKSLILEPRSGLETKILLDNDKQGKAVANRLRKSFFENDEKAFKKVVLLHDKTGIEELISKATAKKLLEQLGIKYNANETLIQNIEKSKISKIIFAKTFYDQHINNSQSLDKVTCNNFNKINDFAKN